MNRTAALLLLAAGLSCGCASAPVVAVKPGFDLRQVGRVALLDFAGFPGQGGSGALVSQALEPYLLQAGYSLVERGQVQRILQEQAFDQSAAVAFCTAEASCPARKLELRRRGGGAYERRIIISTNG